MYLIREAMENTVSHMVSIQRLNQFYRLQWCLVRAVQAVDT